MNQFLVIAAAEKIAAMETERLFEERKTRADQKAFRRILNRKGDEPLAPTTNSAKTIASGIPVYRYLFHRTRANRYRASGIYSS